MAVSLTLSPWPSAGTAGETAALAYIKDQAAAGRRKAMTRPCQLGMLAAALVEREASSAPQAIKNESLRADDWLPVTVRLRRGAV